ncbi:MAG: 4-diphosphocytidyl-2C-methyl-D-erythritol synthase [Solirubrobacterales bacterium]|nr:4-diphosphocytidyl-2C-methyl-D-erythritol synthase [Solirubrobacterales bacterium]
MAEPRAIVAVLAGGRGERLGGRKPSVALAGSPLVCHPLRAAADAGLEAIVVAKRSSLLPTLDAQVVYEPEEPAHPLCGVLAALAFADARPGVDAVVAVACDMPFLSGRLLAWLAGLDGPVMARVDGRDQPLLARWTVSDVPVLEQSLAEDRSMRAALASLAPAIAAEPELSRFGDATRLCFNVNDRDDLRDAEAWLAADEGYETEPPPGSLASP